MGETMGLTFEPATQVECLNIVDKKKLRDFAFAKKTEFFLVKMNGETVGFTGYFRSGKKLRAKNSYILEDHRNKGYFDQIMKWRLARAKDMGCTHLEGTCTKMSLSSFMRHGAKVVKEYKNYTQVEISVAEEK